MKWIKDYLRRRKLNSIGKKMERLQREAMHLQRNGKLRLFADVMQQIEKLVEETREIENEDR